ncbi:MAG: DUF4405 domain-containing protein [Desulfobacteraceae bacterium]|jgi:hypothetical protein
MNSYFQKSWFSPFIAITYLAVSITGLLIWFHLKLPGVYPIHKWGGVIFIVGGIIHLLLNWRMFASYFKKSKAIWGVLFAVLTLVVITLAVPPSDHGGRHPQSSVENSIKF